MYITSLDSYRIVNKCLTYDFTKSDCTDAILEMVKSQFQLKFSVHACVIKILFFNFFEDSATFYCLPMYILHIKINFFSKRLIPRMR